MVSVILDFVASTFYLLMKSLQLFVCFLFFFQAEDGIRDLVRSRGLGDVYKRQVLSRPAVARHRGISEYGRTVVRWSRQIRGCPRTGHELSLIHI